MHAHRVDDSRVAGAFVVFDPRRVIRVAKREKGERVDVADLQTERIDLSFRPIRSWNQTKAGRHAEHPP
jgi:hypothetical protein